MKIMYKQELDGEGKPTDHITLAAEGTHIGAIWGEISIDKDDEFDQRHNIIHIEAGRKRIATIWGAEKVK